MLSGWPLPAGRPASLASFELAIGAIAGRVAESKAQLDQVDRSRRAARQRLADADEHRREHGAVLEALELMADAAIELDAAHGTALQQLRRFRDLEALAGRLSTIAAELAEVRKLASRQAEAREQAEELSLSLGRTTGCSDRDLAD